MFRLLGIFTLISAMTLVGGNVALAAHEEEGHICFFAIDTDKDGRMTIEEFQTAYPNASTESFERFDADSSGDVSHDEYEAGLDADIPLK